MSQDYQYIVNAAVSPKEAFQKVARFTDWWNKKGTGKAESLGDTFKIDWGQTWVDFKIVEAKPYERIVWYVVNCHLAWLKDQTEWNDTKVIWDFDEKDGTTEIKMTHVGITPEVECFEACEAGWNFHVGKSLLKLLTEGTGLPDHGKAA